MGWESSGVVGFDLGPFVQGLMRTAKLKSAYNSLIIGPRGFGALSLWWIQFESLLTSNIKLHNFNLFDYCIFFTFHILGYYYTTILLR